jgi:hypothetical protein
MAQIDLSIWGIRRGFEKDGMFDTNRYPAILATQKDRFRHLCNMLGNKGFFMVQHIESKTVISFVDSSIREFSPGSLPRPGYVVFSLILSNSISFTKSPRVVLERLAAFYKSRVGEGNINNFTESEITNVINSLPTESIVSQSVGGRNLYAYFSQPSEIDDILTGKNVIPSFSNLFLIPGEMVSPGEFKTLDFITSDFVLTPERIDLSQEKNKMRESQQEELRRKLDSERRQDEGKRAEAEAKLKISQGRVLEALQLIERLGHKEGISHSFQHEILRLKSQLKSQETILVNDKRDTKTLESLMIKYNQKDLSQALVYYHELINKEHPNLDKKVKDELVALENAQLAKKRKEDEQKRLEKNKREKKKTNLLVFSLIGSALAIVLVVLSFMFKTPEYLWVSNEAPKSHEDVNNDSNKVHKDSSNNNPKEGTQHLFSDGEKLMNGEEVRTPEDGSLFRKGNKLFNVTLKLNALKNVYQYRSEKETKWNDVQYPSSIDRLNKFYKLQIPSSMEESAGAKNDDSKTNKNKNIKNNNGRTKTPLPSQENGNQATGIIEVL